MKILVSAYACEPNKGSEPGVGWNWVKVISRQHDTWVLTRKNNRSSIERELMSNPDPRLHFVYVDPPKWLVFWKKGQRGVRTYYYLWQFAALARARELNRLIGFDCGHHVTFVNDWLWTFFALSSIPYVWGPIGSHPMFPAQFLSGWRARLGDKARILFQAALRLVDPLYWLSAMRAKTILVINREAQKLVPLSWVSRRKIRIEPAIGVEEIAPAAITQGEGKCKILFMGRFVQMKQPGLALDAFAKLARKVGGACLILLGDGPEEGKLRLRVQKYGLADSVQFLSWLPREEAISVMQGCDIFLFPTMEGGGMVVLEAMAAGKPVVSLDYGGPGEFVTEQSGIKVAIGGRQQVVDDLASALEKLIIDKDLRKTLGGGARLRAVQLQWDKKRIVIDDVYSAMMSKNRQGLA
jgi:glycosyltransferase involved in cell wall biosynthesis